MTDAALSMSPSIADPAIADTTKLAQKDTILSPGSTPPISPPWTGSTSPPSGGSGTP